MLHKFIVVFFLVAVFVALFGATVAARAQLYIVGTNYAVGLVTETGQELSSSVGAKLFFQPMDSTRGINVFCEAHGRADVVFTARRMSAEEFERCVRRRVNKVSELVIGQTVSGQTVFAYFNDTNAGGVLDDFRNVVTKKKCKKGCKGSAASCSSSGAIAFAEKKKGCCKKKTASCSQRVTRGILR